MGNSQGGISNIIPELYDDSLKIMALYKHWDAAKSTSQDKKVILGYPTYDVIVIVIQSLT